VLGGGGSTTGGPSRGGGGEGCGSCGPEGSLTGSCAGGETGDGTGCGLNGVEHALDVPDGLAGVEILVEASAGPAVLCGHVLRGLEFHLVLISAAAASEFAIDSQAPRNVLRGKVG